MQVNQPKGGTAEATTTPLAVGDKVSYVAMSDGGQEYLLEVLTERDTLKTQLNNANQLLDRLAWLLAEGVLTYKPEHPDDSEWFAEAEAALESAHQYQLVNGQPPTENSENTTEQSSGVRNA